MTTEQTNETNAEQVKSAARNAAEKRLRDAHKNEFQAYMIEEHKKRGIEYKPRLSKEERARKEIERLAKEHGISVAFGVETAEDAQANAEILQANAQVPEGTPVTSVEDEERVALARQRLAEASAPTPSAY